MASLVAGCAAAPPPEPRASVAPTSLEEAFARAHPDALPPGLQRTDAGAPEVAAILRREGATELLLPSRLPDGYGLAAPFIGVGNGNALPNPEAWAGGYRVSYTDGRGVITITVGRQRLPGSGPWRPVTGAAWQGRPLAVRTDGATTVVTVRGSGRQTSVTTIGLAERVAVDVLVGIRPWP